MISIIAAMAKNRVIGSKGKLPWHIPEDMTHFRELTTGGTVIMGRRTYEEIGHPLPDRLNIVVSRSRSFCGERLMTARDLDQAISLARSYSRQQESYADIFLCGGESIYREGLPLADRIFLTELDNEYEGDVFFPGIPEEFTLAECSRCEKAGLSFKTFLRK